MDDRIVKHYRLLIIIVIVTGLVASIITSIVIDLTYNEGVQKSLNVVADSSSGSLWGYDKIALSYSIKQVVNQGYFEKLTIYDDYGNEFISSSRNNILGKGFYNLLYPKKIFISEIFYQDHKIGELHASHRSLVIRDVFIAIIFILLITSLLILFIYSYKSNKITIRTMDNLISTQRELHEVHKQASMVHLIRGLAHEFNTPIGSIITLVTSNIIALKDISHKRELTEKEKLILESSEIIESYSGKMARILNRLKELEDIITPEEEVTTNIEEILKIIWFELGLKYKGLKDIARFTINGSLEIPWAEKISSVFLRELLTNCVDFGTIAPSTGEPLEIEVNLLTQNNYYTICILDNGSEIKEGIRESMFEPFVSSRGMGKSLGLGLHISSYIIKTLLGGDINYSRSSNRNIFTIKIPVKLVNKDNI